MDVDVLYLKRREERRVRAGHPWVYSNEVDTARSPLDGLTPGQVVEVRARDDRLLGNGYVNPHSLIAARLVSRTPGEHLGPALIRRRIEQALALRERLFPDPFYRLVYGESDALPGLVVDRFGDVLVVQIGSAGMERQREQVVDALRAVLAPAGVVLRNDLPSRALEGLDSYVEVVHGQVPEQVELVENGVRFTASPTGGQKTGWYYDHRVNRRRLAELAKGRRVLDVFSYTGAWGVQAAAAGAAEVTCVDVSETALAQVAGNAALNGVEGRVGVQRGDAFQVLKALRSEGRRFDLVVLDPPAFIRRKKDMKAGLEAYRRLNRLAFGLLDRDALMVSASCSYHLSAEQLHGALAAAARAHNQQVQVIERGQQGPDHPVHPALAESTYLKALFARPLRD